MHECWLSVNTIIEFQGYTCFTKARKRKKRAKRDSGGLCILIKDCISHLFNVIPWDHEDAFILQISKAYCNLEKDLYFIFSYMRPSTSTSRNNLLHDLDDFDLLFTKVSELREENEIIVIGDLNSRCGILNDFITSIDSNFDPLDESISDFFSITKEDLDRLNITTARKNEDMKLNDYGHKLINLCKVAGLLICNGRFPGDPLGKYTYIDKKGKSSNDFGLVSKGLLMKTIDFKVHDLNAYSDHCPIELDLFDFLHNKHDTDFITPNTTICDEETHVIDPFVSYKFRHDDKDMFLNRLSDDHISVHLNAILEITLNENFVFDEDTIEACINGLIHVIEYAAYPFICNSQPKSSSTSNSQKNTWYDSECSNKKKEFDISKAIYRQTLSEIDLKVMCELRNAYRKLCRKKKKDFDLNNAKNQLSLIKTNPREFWKKIKRRQKKIRPTCDFDTHFKNLFETMISDLSTRCHSLIDETPANVNQTDEFLDAPFTLGELNFALNKLKNNKSPGFDNIINEFLKIDCPLFKNALLSVFNIIFSNGYFPDAWSIGLIIPLHKKGNPNEAENYRGITLLSCVGKLFTSMLNIRLNAWAESMSKFDRDQYGFRDNKSTIDAMFILQNVVDVFLSKNDALFVSFIDLKKAFDCTNHKALFYKLEINNISSKVINVIRNMYQKMKICVKESLSSASFQPCLCFDNNKSNACCLKCNSNQLQPYLFYPCSGVFQGESLSPTLFSLFLNDINHYLQSDANIGISIYQFYLALLLFADDMVLFSDNRFGLQAGLNKLYDYCKDWGLIVNVEKTKCLAFKKNGKKSILDKWHFNGEEIETVTSFKYLGFVFSNTGKFSKGIDHVESQGQRALFNMYSSVDNFDSMYTNMQMSLFNSLVASVLSYSCEIWGFAEAKKVEQVQLKFLKQILKVRKNTPSCIVYKECNVYPLQLVRLFRIISYWIKIIKLDINDPRRIIYDTSLILHPNVNLLETTSNCWAINVKRILYTNGFGYIWENQHMGIDLSFLQVFKTRLIDNFWQKNKTEIEALSIHRLYRYLDSDDIFYLSTMKNNFIRIALTKLRLGSHHLLVERGRWNNTNFENRKCLICNEIEDEFHFVINCVKFHDLRVKYLPKSLYIKPSMFKFISLLNSRNESKLRKLGLFLHFAFKKYTTEELLA